MDDRLGRLQSRIAAAPGRIRSWVAGLTWRRALKLLGVGVLVVVLVGASGFFVYFEVLAHHAPADVERRVRADPNVTVESAHGGFVVRDADPEPERLGVVFYPGGRVAPDAYLPTAARVADRANATVFVPKVTLNLAVFSQGRAGGVIDAHPGVRRWVVGGHSLGGAMACRYVANHENRVEGLLLVGAYCDRPVRGVAGLVVVGTRDRVLNRDRFAATRDNLPESTTVVRVEGMNHSQAGWYTGQRGGRPAEIGFPEAHRRLAVAVDDWLCRELDYCG